MQRPSPHPLPSTSTDGRATRSDADGDRPDVPAPPTGLRAWRDTFISPVFLALVVGAGVVALLGAMGVPGLAGWRPAAVGGLTAMFLIAASGRLSPRTRADLAAMVPSWVPAPRFAVAATAVLEVAGAVGLLIPQTQRLAAVCLALLLIAVFPANVHAARRNIPFGGKPATTLAPRAVEQVLFLACCLAVAFG